MLLKIIQILLYFAAIESHVQLLLEFSWFLQLKEFEMYWGDDFFFRSVQTILKAKWREQSQIEVMIEVSSNSSK